MSLEASGFCLTVRFNFGPTGFATCQSSSSGIQRCVPSQGFRCHLLHRDIVHFQEVRPGLMLSLQQPLWPATHAELHSSHHSSRALRLASELSLFGGRGSNGGSSTGTTAPQQLPGPIGCAPWPISRVGEQHHDNAAQPRVCWATALADHIAGAARHQQDSADFERSGLTLFT